MTQTNLTNINLTWWFQVHPLYLSVSVSIYLKCDIFSPQNHFYLHYIENGSFLVFVFGRVKQSVSAEKYRNNDIGWSKIGLKF